MTVALILGFVGFLIGIPVGGGATLLALARHKRRKALKPIKRTPTPGCYQCHHSVKSGAYLKCRVRRDSIDNTMEYCDLLRASSNTQCDSFEPKELHEESLLREGN